MVSNTQSEVTFKVKDKNPIKDDEVCSGTVKV